MNNANLAQVRAIIGSVGDVKLAAIVATGATPEDVAEAKALADGKSDIAGMGERAIRGPVMEVLTILSSGAD